MLITNILYITGSYIDLFNNIQDTIITKYNNKDYIQVLYAENNYVVTITLEERMARWNKRRLFHVPDSISFYSTVRYSSDKNKILINETFNSILNKNVRINKEMCVYYNIILSNVFDQQLANLRDALIEEITKRKESTFYIVQGSTKLNYVLRIKDNRFVELIESSDDLYVQLGRQTPTKFILYTIKGSEINWKNFVLQQIKKSEWIKLNSENLIYKLFEDFDFFRYENYIGRLISNYNIDIVDKKYRLCNSFLLNDEFFKIPYEEAVVFNDLKRFNLSEKMGNEISDFFKYAKYMSGPQIAQVVSLFFSLSKKIKLIVINRILDSSNSIDSILLIYFLKKISLISEDQRDLFINLNLTYDLFYKEKEGRAFLENHVDRHNLKKVILDYKVEIKQGYELYFIIGFCKLVEELYLENVITSKLYDYILESLKIKKSEGSLISIFKYIVKDYKYFLEIFTHSQDIVCAILFKLVGSDKILEGIGKKRFFNLKKADYIMDGVGLISLPSKKELKKILD